VVVEKVASKFFVQIWAKKDRGDEEVRVSMSSREGRVVVLL
jgi:hypothetical protein